MTIFTDEKGKISTKKVMNISMFLIVVITWICGMWVFNVDQKVYTFVAVMANGAFFQYTFGKKVDGNTP